MLITPLEYRCRICGSTKPIYVSPIGDGEELVIDADDYHRLAESDCPECGKERVHVAAPEVADPSTAPEENDE